MDNEPTPTNYNYFIAGFVFQFLIGLVLWATIGDDYETTQFIFSVGLVALLVVGQPEEQNK